MAKTSNGAKPKPNKGAMALAAKTAAKAKVQAISEKASKKLPRSEHIEGEEDELQEEDTH